MADCHDTSGSDISAPTQCQREIGWLEEPCKVTGQLRGDEWFHAKAINGKWFRATAITLNTSHMGARRQAWI